MSEKLTALVTGAGKPTGIGFELSRQLATRGLRVLLTARSGEAADARASSLRSEGLDVVGYGLDVTNLQQISSVSALINSNYGQLDILMPITMKPPG
jgi:NAD(P)-dependent dehydrogenase (short-subunit alcohol dehydrogenase family)